MRSAGDEGFALLIAMMAVVLLTAFGTALTLSSTSETIIAAQFRNALEARYAAGVLLERGISEAISAPDWGALIDATQRSTWVDGPPGGLRALSNGSTIDLSEVVNQASCHKPTACSLADLIALSPDRPWGIDNPRWTLYAHGALQSMLPPGGESACYVVLLIGNGPSSELLAIRAEAFGPRGSHAVTEVALGRRAVAHGEKDYNDDSEQGVVTILSWREVR